MRVYNRKRTIHLPMYVIPILVGLFFLMVSSVSAQSFNLEVSPAKVNQMVEPGGEFVQTYRVGNYSGEDQDIFVYTSDFAVTSEEGSLRYFEAEGESAGRYSLSGWIDIPTPKIRIPDGRVREVDVAVTIPVDAEAGGHYAAVFFQSQPPEGLEDGEGTQIGSVSRIAALLLLTVPGDVDENMTLTDFFAEKNVYWDSNPDVVLTSMVQNNGNVHMIPSGVIFMRGGIWVDHKNLQYNTKQIAVLPEAPARIIEETVGIRGGSGFLPPMGKMQAELDGRYGITEPQTFGGTTSFWVIPIKFILIVLLILIIGGFILWRVLVSFRKDKKPKSPASDTSSESAVSQPVTPLPN